MNTKIYTALRDDFERAIGEGLELEREARTIANRCLHLVVLHGLLPEIPRS